MAQFVSRSGPSLPPGVVTVAELLQRNIPAPRPAPDDSGPSAAEAIPVGALLRREGRAPHALDRPVHPRGAQAADDDDETPGVAPLILRRGVAAAGALLAVGAVFGAAVVTDGTGRLEAAIGGAFPGPDDASGGTLGGATAPLDGFGGAASAFGAVDAATGLPVGVAPAAFATGLASALPGLVGTSTPTAARPAPAAVPPATSAPPAAPARSSAAPAPPRPAPATSRSDGPVERLGGTVGAVGGAVGGPVGGAVSGVGGVVRDAPGTLTHSDPAPSTRSSKPEPERDSALSTLSDPVESTVDGVGRAAADLLGG